MNIESDGRIEQGPGPDFAVDFSPPVAAGKTQREIDSVRGPLAAEFMPPTPPAGTIPSAQHRLGKPDAADHFTAGGRACLAFRPGRQ